jgi:hypothetical protein
MPSQLLLDSPQDLRTTELRSSCASNRGHKKRCRGRIARCMVLLFAAVALACTARADTVTLENGDRLTGTIVKSDAKELILKTDDTRSATDNPAGLITLQWSAVRQITSSAPLYVVTQQKTTVGGMVTTEGTDLVVTPATGAPQRVPLGNVTTIRSQTEETTYERSLHPGLFESWQANASLGFGLARGNSHTTNLTIGFNADRATLHDKLTAYMNSIYASSGLVIGPGGSGVTADDLRGGVMYQHDLSFRTFAYGSADFEHNQLQFLNLRSILGAGGGYHAIKRMETTLDLFGGANYTRESYSTGVRRNIAALTFGDLFRHAMGKNTVFNQTLDVYPELSHLGQYRIALDMSLATKIKAWLAWQSTLSDRYISDPIPGTVNNDVIFSTGFNFSFTR